jgi:RNA polymerase sigma-70 factor (ECF subfamily)
MDLTPESQLIAWCREGKPEAWDEIFSRHYNPTCRFLFQFSPDFSREDVEEICQEVFLAVIRNLDTFQGQSQFQTWLFRIAVNKARDFLERQRAAKRGGGQVVLSLQAEDPQTGLAIDPPSSSPNPEMSLLGGEQVAIIRNALDHLGDPCREMIELRYFGDLSYDEIGAALKIHTKTVSSRLSRCLDRLEEFLRPRLEREKSRSLSV